jgi:hypothetical protein
MHSRASDGWQAAGDSDGYKPIALSFFQAGDTVGSVVYKFYGAVKALRVSSATSFSFLSICRVDQNKVRLGLPMVAYFPSPGGRE